MSGNVPVGMSGAGYVIPEPTEERRIFAMTEGPEKCGKTDFTLRHTPGPIAIASFDTGTKALVDKHIELSGKDIWLWQGKRPRTGQTSNAYASAWSTFEKQHRAVMAAKEIRTYVWDTATNIWELFRLFKFGKLTQVKPHHYGPVNEEFAALIRDMYEERPDLNFIAVHTNKKQYMSKGDKDAWTGKYERAGFGDFRYLADICLQHYYRDGFGIRVMPNEGVGARQSPDLVDLELEDEECSFFWLAQNVYPETDPEHWWDGSANHPLAD